jgi:hypothetical protein
VALFTVDEIRRIVTESLLPYFCQNKDAMAKEIKRASAAATKNIARKLSMRKVKSLELKEDSFGTDDDMSDAEVVEMKRKARLEDIMTEEIAELEKDEIEMFD